ncbi:MAG: transaldolase family protein, partial [Burkholderiales bacterium]
YNEFKRRGHATVVMAASFRSTAQIEALAGCDRLTIAPDLMQQLDREFGPLVAQLRPVAAAPSNQLHVDAAQFAHALANDTMASEKLGEGIAAFASDLAALRQRITAHLDPG